MKAKIARIYMITMLGLVLFLLITLTGFDIFPITSGNNTVIVNQQADIQLARAEFITKDILTIAYRPNNKAQAVGELQAILPQFQKIQNGLLKGDTSLGFPNNPPDNVQSALLSTQGDYSAFYIAANTILTHVDHTPDPTQVNIVFQRERPYIQSMAIVISLLQNNAQNRDVQLLIIKMIICGLIGTISILKYTLFTRDAVRTLIIAEEKEESDGR